MRLPLASRRRPGAGGVRSGNDDAPTGAVPTQASGNTCVTLFQQFDILEQMYPSNQRRYDNRVAPPLVEAQAQRVRNAGCITLTSDLAGMEAVGGPPITESGPAIAADLAACRGGHQHAGRRPGARPSSRRTGFPPAAWGARRSGGGSISGRSPTQGALDAARDLALRAGFAAPYPARF